MKDKYTKNDVGCYIDGAVPRTDLEYAQRIWGLINDKAPYLAGEPVDESDLGVLEFGIGLIDNLLDALMQCTDEDCIWIQEAGDLILTTEDQAS